MNRRNETPEILAERLGRWMTARGFVGTIGEARDLTGGLSSRMTAVTLHPSEGREIQFVLRQPSDWTLKNLPDAVERESQILKQLQVSGVAAPVPYGLEKSGGDFGRPTLVLEYLDGAPELHPSDRSHFLRSFAEHLAQIHRAPVGGEAWDFLRPAHGMCWNPCNDSIPPGEAAFLGRAREVLRGLGPPPTVNKRCLVHGDFWPANVLWQGREWVATIDWEEFGLGDPLMDLSISRLDLAWAFGWDAMIEFTGFYLVRNPLDLADLAFWDLRASLRPGKELEKWAAGYADLHRADVTLETMTRTLMQFVEQAQRGGRHE